MYVHFYSKCQIYPYPISCWGFPDGLAGKESTCNAGDVRDVGSIPGLGRSLEEEMQPTELFLPEKSHGQRSLAGYSPKGRKESDTTKPLSTHSPFPFGNHKFGFYIRESVL